MILMKHVIQPRITVEYVRKNYPQYYSIVEEILTNEEFLKRKNYPHHGEISVFDHSLRVSLRSYLVAEKLKLDYHRAAIGGLLHDFYDKPWQQKPVEEDSKKEKLLEKHGFVHAKQALKNAKFYFPDMVDKKTANIIIRHMFPLNLTPPRYVESWIVTLADKYVSCEIFKHPLHLYRYLGIGRDGK